MLLSLIDKPVMQPVIGSGVTELVVKDTSSDADLMLTPPSSPLTSPSCSTKSKTATIVYQDEFDWDCGELCDYIYGLPVHEFENLIKLTEELKAVMNEPEPRRPDEELSAHFINKDPMWSDPALQSAGLAGRYKKNHSIDDHIMRYDQQFLKDIQKCVDPSVVFPCAAPEATLCTASPSSISQRLSPAGSKRRATSVETPPTSESDDEIDVVSVEKRRRLSSTSLSSIGDDDSSSNTSQISLLSSNPSPSILPSRPTIRVIDSGSNANKGGSGMSSILTSVHLPATTSMSAQVAAMHNYSSTAAAPSVKQSHSYNQSCLRPSLSAPQTPHHGSGYASSKAGLRRVGSSPSSPQMFNRKQGHRLGHRGINERDLQSVSRKLVSAGSNNRRRMKHVTTSHSYSRQMAFDADDLSDVGKRNYHNSLERQRREDIRFLFTNLRQSVPSLRDNQRAPKMTVLQHASDYVRHLMVTEQKLRVEERRQRMIRDQLQRRLDYLENVHVY